MLALNMSLQHSASVCPLTCQPINVLQTTLVLFSFELQWIYSAEYVIGIFEVLAHDQYKDKKRKMCKVFCYN